MSELKVVTTTLGEEPTENVLMKQIKLLSNKINYRKFLCAGYFMQRMDGVIKSIIVDKQLDIIYLQISLLLSDILNSDIMMFKQISTRENQIRVTLKSLIHYTASGPNLVNNTNKYIEYTVQTLPTYGSNITINEETCSISMKNYITYYKENPLRLEEIYGNDEIFKKYKMKIAFTYKIPQSLLRWYLASLRITNIIGFLMMNCDENMISNMVNSDQFIRNWVWNKSEIMFKNNFKCIDQEKSIKEYHFINTYLNSFQGTPSNMYAMKCQQLLDINLN
jgi:hypothetical protein